MPNFILQVTTLAWAQQVSYERDEFRPVTHSLLFTGVHISRADEVLPR